MILGIDDPILEIAKSLEQEALTDAYFVDRKLYPNVDFYSGIIYRAMGIPVEMFTVMFALGRLPGWIGTMERDAFRKRTYWTSASNLYRRNTYREFKNIAQR